MPITSVKIYPPIGIARLGNSPTDFFIGPERPGDHAPPAGGYRDDSCRIKRQAARFRLFGFDGNTLVGEITAADAQISWTVHLANTKSSWKEFNGLAANMPLRNAGVANRASLEINSGVLGARTLTAPNQKAGFNTGQFLGKFVPLGEMQTDAEGRLLVLGGFGSSGSVPAGQSIVNYANNDLWHDDVSDGPVTATVLLNGEMNPLQAEPAWVICPPTDFAPPVDSLTSLYDTLFQVAVDQGQLAPPAIPSFTADIFPILQRVFNMRRTTEPATAGHADFSGSAAAAMSANRRTSVFNNLRIPPSYPNPPAGAGSGLQMPWLFDDNNGLELALTRVQYGILHQWRLGNFVADWPGNPPPPQPDITPDGLTRAALEACVGAAFYPGIEASWFVRDIYAYSEPFRLDHTGRAPGDVTKQMAVPWQADFLKCSKVGSFGWWPSVRPDDVVPEGTNTAVPWTRDVIGDHLDMVGHWQKLGFVVEKGGELVEAERRVVCTNLHLITDKSHFGKDEVDAGLPQALFEDALYVVAEGFLPADLGVTQANPTPQQLAGIAPAIVIRRADNNPAPDMVATPQELLLELPELPSDQRQRFTFVYRVEFSSTAAFLVNGQPEDQTLAVEATKNGFSATGALVLFHQANPYMLDGPTSWLATDVRVFQLTEGQNRFGLAMGNDAAGASTFIGALLDSFNSLPPANHPFDTISTDQQASRLELSEKVANQRVFNFAVARVRLKGAVMPANDVRVFFRLFTTAATGLDFDELATYRRSPGSAPISLLGLQAGHLVTLPCYAAPRIDTTTQPLTAQTDGTSDDLNVRTLQPAGNSEVMAYFGAWLDFNQTTPRFPLQPAPQDGPWNANLKSIQELIRGLHQCLVAEVFFAGDPIPVGATPAANENLAQRNLIIRESDNPGSAATHTVQHTFEIKATRPRPQVLTEGIQLETGVAPSPRFVPAGPDELMIRWHGLPAGTTIELYMPDVDAETVRRLAGQSHEHVGFDLVDAHTLRCRPAQVTYVPLPLERQRNTPGLLTVFLPDGVRRGQEFKLTVHHVSGQPRKILGAFELGIPVSSKAALLAPETRALSVLRHIHRAIPLDDPWYPIFRRHLDHIAERVRGFGGNPDTVAPAADGSGRDPAAERCTRWAWLVSLLLALTLMFVGLASPAATLFGLAAVVAAYSWSKHCQPSAFKWLLAALAGCALGAGGLAAMLAAGISTALTAPVLAAAGLAAGALALYASARRWFGGTP